MPLSVQQLWTWFYELDQKADWYRRRLLLRILRTEDGYSMESLENLRKKQGVKEDKDIKRRMFKCKRCQWKSNYFHLYNNHLSTVHLPFVFLTDAEKKLIGKRDRQPIPGNFIVAANRNEDVMFEMAEQHVNIE